MNQNKRPLSPFMLGADYKLQFTSIMSFLHRATGVALVLVMIVIAFWLCALASGPVAFARVNAFITHILFFPFLCAGVIAGCYHFCNGIRHLFWDAGCGLSREAALRSARIVQVATGLLTLAILITAALS